MSKGMWHLKICRALPGFAKEIIDDYREDRFAGGSEELLRIYKEINDKFKLVRGVGSVINTIYEFSTIDCFVTYDVNAFTAVVAYSKEDRD